MAKVYTICIVCGNAIPLPSRKFKNTCSDACHELKIKQIGRRAYASKMDRDPLYAQKNSARQYQHLLVKNSHVKKKSKNRKINKIKIEAGYVVVGGYDISVQAILQELSEKTGKDYFSI